MSILICYIDMYVCFLFFKHSVFTFLEMNLSCAEQSRGPRVFFQSVCSSLIV